MHLTFSDGEEHPSGGYTEADSAAHEVEDFVAVAVGEACGAVGVELDEEVGVVGVLDEDGPPGPPERVEPGRPVVEPAAEDDAASNGLSSR